jgi:mannose-6-phosphate isomerase-like protein (cupin superfamily)
MNAPQTADLRLHNRHTDEIVTLRRRHPDGELVLEIRGSIPPHREGPPMHVHYFEDEEGRVTAGRLSAVVGGRRVDVGLGETVRLPKGVPHRWWNEGEATLEFEGVVRPVEDFDRYLQAVFEVVNAGAQNRPPLFYLAHVALRHRRTQAMLLMPRPIQAIVFRVVVAVGTILGRYRGTEWPGCPARCPGAPAVINAVESSPITRSA